MESKKQHHVKACKYLRARNSYGLMEGGENPWIIPDDANTICWCIKTGGQAAPDNGMVTQYLCMPGRKCYEAPKQ